MAQGNMIDHLRMIRHDLWMQGRAFAAARLDQAIETLKRHDVRVTELLNANTALVMKLRAAEELLAADEKMLLKGNPAYIQAALGSAMGFTQNHDWVRDNAKWCDELVEAPQPPASEQPNLAKQDGRFAGTLMPPEGELRSKALERIIDPISDVRAEPVFTGATMQMPDGSAVGLERGAQAEPGVEVVDGVTIRRTPIHEKREGATYQVGDRAKSPGEYSREPAVLNRKVD